MSGVRPSTGGKTVSDLSDPPLTDQEVKRRMPSLALIEDSELRGDVRRLTRFAPPYFWTRAGSTMGYHNAHECGLWAHTLKLSTAIDRIADSFVEQELIVEADVDRAHAAAILHDQRKAGPAGGDEKTDRDHDLQMGTGVRKHIDDELVARAVESHMGPWYEGPEPRSPLDQLVHVADMIASSRHIDMALPEPVPNELVEHGYEGYEP